MYLPAATLFPLPIVSETVRQLRALDKITEAQANEYRRLPRISAAEARTLLGPLADTLPTPPDLKSLANPCPPELLPDYATTTTTSPIATVPPPPSTAAPAADLCRGA